MRTLIAACLPALSVWVFAVEPAPCIHFRHDGNTFCLAYGPQNMAHADIRPLPPEAMADAQGWAFNCSHAGVISQAMRFRVMARLATVDTREAHGHAKGPCSFGPWSIYEWRQHADQAFLGLQTCLGKDDPLIMAFKEKALQAGLARKSSFYGIEFKGKRLTPKRQKALFDLFGAIELMVADRPELGIVRISLEEKIRKEPRTKETFMKFEVSE